MIFNSAVDDSLSDLLAENSFRLTEKLSEFINEIPQKLTPPSQLFTSSKISRTANNSDREKVGILPSAVVADPRYAMALAKIDKANEEEIVAANSHFAKQISTLLGEWQGKRIEQQLPRIERQFEEEELEKVFNWQESLAMLREVQEKYRLVVLVAPPKVSPSCPSSLQYDLEIDVAEEMKTFLDFTYPTHSDERGVLYYGDYFKRPIGEADLHLLHSVIEKVPTIVLHATVSDRKVYLHIGWWHFHSNSPERFDLSGWDWETVQIAALDIGRGEIEAIRNIRQSIVLLHQFFAAFLIDIYYLLVNPRYQPQLPNLRSTWYEGGLNAAAIDPYMEFLNGLQSRQRSEHRQEVAAMSVDRAEIASQGEDWRCVDVFSGHDETIHSLAFAPTGKLLVSGSTDRTIKVWDLYTGSPIHTLGGHLWVYGIDINPDGNAIASGSGDRTVKVWDLRAGTLLRTINAHDGNISAVAFVPNTQMLVSASWDYSLKIWNLRTGHKIRTLSGHESMVNDLAIGRDGLLLASASHDRTIKIWQLRTGQELMTLVGHKGSVNSVAFGPDGLTLASGSDDRSVKLWNLETGAEMFSFPGYISAVNCVKFNSTGDLLASGGDDRVIKLWSPKTGQLVKTLAGHIDSIYAIAFSPDGKTIASGSSDCQIRLWET
jgi:WD40 repeat protein